MKTSISLYKLLIILVLPVAVLFSSCGTANQSAGESPEYRAMVERVNDLDFEIENEWANPVRGNRINLQGNNNYIRFDGEQVDLFLPYFGVRHSGGGYGAEGAIKYEGTMENLQIRENPRKEQVEVFFSGSHRSENFDIHMTIYPNGNTSTSVGSSQRDRISYDGRIQK